MRFATLILVASTLALPATAHAAQFFQLRYLTSVDSTSGPAVFVDALLTTDDGDFYGIPGYRVTSITGTRGSDAITFDSSAFNDEIFYPGDGSGNYVDGFGLDFIAGGVTYNLYKNGAGDFAYHEFDGSTGRLIANRDISLAPVATSVVPEPASWAFMVWGFGMIGLAMRSRRQKVAAIPV